MNGKLAQESEKPAITLPGTVEKIIPPLHPAEPEKAQIAVEGADHLYRELRVDNELIDERGKTVSLKPGAHVAVTIEAEAEGTRPTDRSEQTHAAQSSPFQKQ
jgi:hypothetical protein